MWRVTPFSRRHVVLKCVSADGACTSTTRGSAMNDLSRWMDIEPYSMDRDAKEEHLAARLVELTRFHYANCAPYARMLDAVGFDPSDHASVEGIPFLPVRLFKELDLLSVPRDEIVKTMTSSGTTGQAVSKIYLDKQTASDQTRVLTRLVSTVVGPRRLPMIVVDSPDTVKDRLKFSARAAGILGFSMFARDRMFALDSDMSLDVEALRAFLEKHAQQPILVFGFTFMVWQHLYKELRDSGQAVDLSQGVLLHGGGWKKLVNESVSTWDFRRGLHDVCGITRVHDYYGMVEQTGSIYLECEHGHLHASIFSDVIIRRPLDFTPAAVGEPGLIEVVSVLPGSYPGHALLTEDQGVLLGEDDCACGRQGKYFAVLGRVQNAELRGCSDTYGAAFTDTERQVLV